MTGSIVWFTGLPASGKSTAARRLLGIVRERGRPSCLLDGDDVRESLVPRRGHTDPERDAFYATLSRLAGLLASQGLCVIVAATAHRRAYRDDARDRAPRFFEVLVKVTADVCAERDEKGLYAGARAGRIKNLPGVGIPYEPPRRPDAVLSGGHDIDGIARLAELVAPLGEDY